MTRRRQLALGVLLLVFAAGAIAVPAAIAIADDEEATMVFSIEGMR